jgi:hypothetical protein
MLLPNNELNPDMASWAAKACYAPPTPHNACSPPCRAHLWPPTNTKVARPSNKTMQPPPHMAASMAYGEINLTPQQHTESSTSVQCFQSCTSTKTFDIMSSKTPRASPRKALQVQVSKIFANSWHQKVKSSPLLTRHPNHWCNTDDWQTNHKKLC